MHDVARSIVVDYHEHTVGRDTVGVLVTVDDSCIANPDNLLASASSSFPWSCRVRGGSIDDRLLVGFVTIGSELSVEMHHTAGFGIKFTYTGG